MIPVAPVIDHSAGFLTPHQLDPRLAATLYGDAGEALLTFFYRRTRDANASTALLAETFAVAALHRRTNPSLDATDTTWLSKIAKLELSKYFRDLSVQTPHSDRLGCRVSPLTDADVAALEAAIHAAGEQPRLAG